jgi:endonuclease/exonuclease/phosphatase family metal-dependent hydrolase
MRVVTFNVWNQDGDAKRGAVINGELRRLDPDLVALQEVVRTPERDQLSSLVEGLGLFWSHQADLMPIPLPATERYGGTAIGTRWPHRIVEVLDMRQADALDTPWATLAAEVTIPDLGDLLFIATTLAWHLTAEAARERQVLALAELDARHRRKLPTIMAGDFNAAPEAASIRHLMGLQSLGGRSVRYDDAWTVAGKGPGYTWSVDNPNAASVMDAIVRQPNHRRRIDYIFIGTWEAHPQARCTIRSARLAFDQPSEGIWPSDHFGVLADLDLVT